MMFSTHRESVIGLLVLRHLHTGNVIDYPAPESLPQIKILKTLEDNGFIERWNRLWPLADRYRLTAKGVQAIQAAYRPDNAEAVLQQLRARNLAPSARPQALRALGYDPNYWPILHDPHTHWMTWPELIGPYQRYIWEPELPRVQAPRPAAQARPGAPRQARPRPAPRRQGGFSPSPSHYHQHHIHHHHVHEIEHLHHQQHDHGHHGHDHGGHDHGGFDPGEYGSSGQDQDPGTWGDSGFEGGGGESGGGGSSDGWGYETENLDGGSDGGGSDGGWDNSGYGDVS